MNLLNLDKLIKAKNKHISYDLKMWKSELATFKPIKKQLDNESSVELVWNT